LIDNWEESMTGRNYRANILGLAAALVGRDELSYGPEDTLESILDNEYFGISLSAFASIVLALLPFTFPSYKDPDLPGQGMRQTFGSLSDNGAEYSEFVARTWVPWDVEHGFDS